jgi:hypothetical protein
LQAMSEEPCSVRAFQNDCKHQKARILSRMDSACPIFSDLAKPGIPLDVEMFRTLELAGECGFVYIRPTRGPPSLIHFGVLAARHVRGLSG